MKDGTRCLKRDNGEIVQFVESHWAPRVGKKTTVRAATARHDRVDVAPLH
ncbi:hypothetical protein [Burkholderia lata]|nr:hypothetical protein [Burkholderia lata]